MVVALGSVIALSVLAQQQTDPNPQMQEEADKGAKTRQSGESGYVGEQYRSTTGLGHVGSPAQRDLPPIHQGCPSGPGQPGSKAMIEVVSALLAFLSISMFLAHAVDAYRARG
jgi:hypothetical protein